jgi:hypothetical protein
MQYYCARACSITAHVHAVLRGMREPATNTSKSYAHAYTHDIFMLTNPRSCIRQALKEKNVPVRTVAERCMLHLMSLYAGLDIATSVSKSLREADALGLIEYCKRTIAKGPDALAVSDDEE